MSLENPLPPRQDVSYSNKLLSSPLASLQIARLTWPGTHAMAGGQITHEFGYCPYGYTPYCCAVGVRFPPFYGHLYTLPCKMLIMSIAAGRGDLYGMWSSHSGGGAWSVRGRELYLLIYLE